MSQIECLLSEAAHVKDFIEDSGVEISYVEGEGNEYVELFTMYIRLFTRGLLSWCGNLFSLLQSFGDSTADMR